jgi:transposase-like protein
MVGKAGLALEAREGERSETERAEGASPAGGGSVGSRNGTPDPEVPAKKSFRRYTAAYKLKVLLEADRCTKPGETGALLRREGLYSSLLSSWRRQRDAGQLDGLAGKKRGNRDVASDKKSAEIKRLRRDNQRLARKLRQAEVVIDIQKKVSELLGIPLNSPEDDENA